MTEDKKKYNYLETMLTKINQNYISLSKEDESINNKILDEILTIMINRMRNKNKLFDEMYTRVFYGGSYYDGLRVGKPDEFDLHILLNLPKLAEPEIDTGNVPGYVKAKFNLENFKKQKPLVERYKGLDKLLKDDYFDTAETLQWMEGVVTLALKTFQQDGSWYILNTPIANFKAKITKHGPAFTMQVQGQYKSKNILFDVDLVPCFIFGENKWPKKGFKSNPIKKKPEFFIVPKPLKRDVSFKTRYWLLSFQAQERILIEDKRTLKPTIKLLKKLRDKYDHQCIASYFLKTVVLRQIDNHDDAFWRNSLSYVFVAMLKEYYKCLCVGNIPYYWNKNYNLICNVKSVTITNIANKIKLIIDEIEKSQDPLVIAKHLLSKTEMATL